MIRLIFLLSLLMFSAQGAEGLRAQANACPPEAAKGFPTLYDALGTPLFQSPDLFREYDYLGDMKSVNRRFEAFMQPIYQKGMELSAKKSLQGKERNAYLKQLRALENERKRVMHELTDLTMKAVDEDDLKTFTHLLTLPLDELLPTMSTKTKAIDYYQSKRKKRIAEMEKLASDVKKHRQERLRRCKEGSFEVDNGPRTYELKNHLPAQGSVTPEPQKQAEEDDDSLLKKLGELFKSNDVDFDPSLLEEYKGHQPPSLHDIK